MKRLSRILLLILPLVTLMQACYDDYKVDYPYTACYFAMQDPLRTVVVEQGKEAGIKIGVMMGGKYVNDRNETVGFEIQPALLDDYPMLELLPAAYYELSNASEIVIPEGEFLGTIQLTLNENFLNDDSAHVQHYALPLQIVSSTTDSVLAEKDWSIIAIKYQNEYYGSYWLKGVDYTLDSLNVGNPPLDTFAYSKVDLVSNYFITFETASMDTSVLPYVGPDISGSNSMKIAVKDDGSVKVLPAMESSVNSVSGMGSYDEAKRTFYLDYTFEKGSSTHQVYDTLIYFATPMQLETWQ